MIKNNKGVTLIEMIIVVALVGIVITVSFSLLSFGNRLLAITSEEYNLQASTRYAVERVNTELRFSTATFALPMTNFQESQLTDGFEYIGVSNDGKEIVYYKSTGDPSNPWEKKILVPPIEDVEYRLVFQKLSSDEDNKLLTYHFEVKSEDGSFTKVGLSSELEAMQSRSIRDMGTISDPAQVIAFSRKPIESHRGNIAMVLDLSGSMDNNMNNGSGGKSRLSILKEEAAKLVNGLAPEDNVYISLVPFATNANDPYPFVSSKATSILINYINNFNASGGTNTGDGIRRAYYQLIDAESSEPSLTHSNYAIILVDGNTTFSTVKKENTGYDINYYDSSGDVEPSNRHTSTINDEFRFRIGTHNIHESDGQIAGYGNKLDNYGTTYVNQMGDLLKNQIRRAYVIGFSALSDDLQSVNDIATAVGASSDQVFVAGSQEDLDAALEQIREDIVNDFWFLKGPSY